MYCDVRDGGGVNSKQGGVVAVKGSLWGLSLQGVGASRPLAGPAPPGLSNQESGSGTKWAPSKHSMFVYDGVT